MRYGALSHEQARFFRDQGYYRLLGVYTTELIDKAREFVMSEATTSSDAINPSNPNQKLYGLYDRNPDLIKQFIGNTLLTGALESLLGPNIVFVKNRHNHATVNSRQGAPAEGLHRNILQPSRGLITAAVYLQSSTAKNGATRVIPGSHKLPYVGVPQANGGGTWMAEHEEYAGLEDQAVPVPMNAGDVLLFDGTLFHGVGYNPTGQTRISMTLGFRSADELDAQPDFERQTMVAGQQIYRGNDI